VDPVYDPAYFEDLAGRLYGLVISISGRLPADQAQWLLSSEHSDRQAAGLPRDR
jgi:hypothetical protein